MAPLPHNLHPCLRLGRRLLALALLVVTAVSAGTSPESDLYALSKLKSSLLSGSASNSPLLADWDIETSASGGISSRPNHCNFSEITCDASNRVVSINLTGVPLHGGVLPREISLLDGLSSLTVASCSLSGVIPASLASMPLLRHLNLSINNVSGSFPFRSAPPYFRSVEVIDVYDNNLTGPLPPFGMSHARMQHLDLGWNHFSGGISEEYGDMNGLEFLGLDGNWLSGLVPPSLSRLRRVKRMYLGHYNSFHGGIPPEFGELSALIQLEMSNCNLTGPFPPELGRLTQLELLYLFSNNLVGEIPAELGSLKNLTLLDLSFNQLTGEIPASFASLTRLKLLSLTGNKLHGVIPEFVGELPQLEIVHAWQNNLTGEIPANLGKNGMLLELDVTDNQLSGTIPSYLCAGRQLQFLFLMRNKLSGPIPEDLGNCKTLARVRLNNNFLSGSIPAGLLDLPMNDMLDLSNNLLSGELPTVIPSAGLRFLSVASNNLSGPVAPEIGHLKKLSLLNASANALTAGIPRQINHCESLIVIDLSRNQLTGEIPKEITSLKVLTVLYLSRNRISGELPVELGEMISLSKLDVSYNDLSGRVSLPQLQGVFAVSDKTDFEGNHGLCVEHITAASCPIPMSLQSSRRFKPRMLLWIVPTASALAVVVCLGLRWGRRAWRETAKRRPVTWKMTRFQNLELGMDDVLRCLREENVIGRGGAGTVYRCVTRDGTESTRTRCGWTRRRTCSFGVVLLELVTGRRPLGDFGDEIDLVHWGRSVVPRPTDTAAVLAVADPRLPPEPAGLIARLFRVGISCVRESSQARPTMREVVHVLSSFVVPPADPACSVSALPL
ncbi:unnamed protein product [Miscanthus lutarioriparius]|uniref:Leucine-rich repeat-containing N-terminal plant-type domain-containing protein n=1 Tax=Miscanthus lutarioriparius TaxID=422564 RepID=A0A811PTV5_9POAL|nr:unnamed protein product [Miscanthus lutarioriparius]